MAEFSDAFEKINSKLNEADGEETSAAPAPAPAAEPAPAAAEPTTPPAAGDETPAAPAAEETPPEGETPADGDGDGEEEDKDDETEKAEPSESKANEADESDGVPKPGGMLDTLRRREAEGKGVVSPAKGAAAANAKEGIEPKHDTDSEETQIRKLEEFYENTPSQFAAIKLQKQDLIIEGDNGARILLKSDGTWGVVVGDEKPKE